MLKDGKMDLCLPRIPQWILGNKSSAMLFYSGGNQKGVAAYPQSPEPFLSLDLICEIILLAPMNSNSGTAGSRTSSEVVPTIPRRIQKGK